MRKAGGGQVIATEDVRAAARDNGGFQLFDALEVNDRPNLNVYFVPWQETPSGPLTQFQWQPTDSA